MTDRDADSDSIGQRPLPQQPLPRLVYTSRDLFRGRNEVFIDHANETYTLRITSNDKLLLTK